MSFHINRRTIGDVLTLNKKTNNMKKLILPINKKWFDLILSADKTEEYREIKPFYVRRFLHAKQINDIDNFILKFLNIAGDCFKTDYTHIEFRNGYGKQVPSFVVELKIIEINTGLARWGAEPNKLYFVLKLGNFVEMINKTPEQIQYENEAADQCNHLDTSNNSEGYQVCNNCGAYLKELGVDL